VVNAAQKCTTPNTLDQSCIVNSLGTGNVAITVPPGTYTINSLITISQPNVTIYCQPGAVFKTNYSGSEFLLTGANSSFSGCTFNGNEGAYACTGSCDDIQISGASNVILDADTIENATQWGVDGTSNAGGNGVNGLVIRHSTFTGNLFSPIALSGPSKNIVITGNQDIDASAGTSSESGSAILIHSGNTGNITGINISGNQIKAGTQFCVEYGTFGSGTMSNTNVNGNTCIAEAAGDGGFSSLGVTNGTESGNTVDVNGQADTIACYEYVEDIGMSSTGNTCNQDGGSLAYHFSVNQTKNSTFSGNTLLGISGTGGSGPVAGFFVAGGSTQPSSDNVISDNNISFASGATEGVGIHIQTPGSAYHQDRNLLSHNHIYGTSNTNLQVGISVDNSEGGSLDSTTLDGNEIYATSYGVIHTNDSNTIDRFTRCTSIGAGGCQSGTAGTGETFVPWQALGADGTALQLSDGSWLSGDYAAFTAYGSTTDSGIPIGMVAGANQIYNGSMATGSGSAATGWGTSCLGNATCAFLWDNSTVPTGYTYAQKIQITVAGTNPNSGATIESNQSPGSLFSVTNGGTASLVFYAKATTATNVVAFVGQSSNYNNQYCTSQPYYLVPSVWTPITTSVKCTATASDAALYLNIPNAVNTVWVTGASLVPPAAAGTVTDGSGTTTTPEFAESTSVAHILQYRTPAQALSDMGAAAAQGNATDESSSWSLSNSEPYRVNCSTACTGTLPSTISTGFVAAVNNVGAATVTIAGGGPTLVCAPVAACTIPPGGNGLVYTDGTDWYLIDGGNATEINGGAVPASAAVIATNSSGQPASAATTGSGNVVLATSPTLSGATLSGTTLGGTSTMQGNVTLENGANSNQTLAIQPGSSAEQIGAVQFNSYTGTSEWQLRKDASNNLRVTDAVNSLDRVILPANANTTINAGAGANAVAINNTSGSGTSGFIVYEGGTNNSTAAFQVSGSGNTTATGYLQGKFIMGSGTIGVAANAAAGTSPTIACATSHVCDGVSGTVTLTTGTSTTTGTLATLNFPNTHTNQANCMVSTLSSTGIVTSNTWTESTTAITITANTALTASTAYTIKYWCGSY
jgi:hypothetical protein